MSYDVLIKDGRILDGTGNPWYLSDIGIQNGRIENIDRNLTNADIIIDASDLIVSPGFIDVHSHSDMTILFEPRQDSMIKQGITTSVVGNCGFSLAPINNDRIHIIKKQIEIFLPPGAELDINWRTFDQYLKRVGKSGCALNVVSLIGFGTTRIAGGPAFEDREPTQKELMQMEAHIEEAMKAGAFGLSTGLIYTPQLFAKTQEVIELAKIVAKYNGLYFSHIRNESSKVVEAIDELIKIVELSGCIGGQVGHHKVSGKNNWGLSNDTLGLISDAYSRGLNITCDQYPYNRGMTSLVTVLPPWVHIGGVDTILEHLDSEDSRKKIKDDINSESEEVEGWENWFKNIGAANIYISSVKSNSWKDIEGKNIAEITKIKRYEDDFETLFNLLLEEKAEVTMTIETMGEEDMERIMINRYTMIGTDGWGVSCSGGKLDYGKPHPRFYGTYPRILGRFVRDKGLLSVEEAIRKMTSFPAQKLGLSDRGILRRGAWADIVLFNPKTVIDLATYENPHQFPKGVHYVLVNGQIVVDDEEFTNKLPGVVVKKKQRKDL
ncbi:MAG: N-acyl-D-amino-acid deacylase family protein [Candidatus Hodarchaeales archaeon]